MKNYLICLFLSLIQTEKIRLTTVYRIPESEILWLEKRNAESLLLTFYDDKIELKNPSRKFELIKEIDITGSIVNTVYLILYEILNHFENLENRCIVIFDTENVTKRLISDNIFGIFKYLPHLSCSFVKDLFTKEITSNTDMHSLIRMMFLTRLLSFIFHAKKGEWCGILNSCKMKRFSKVSFERWLKSIVSAEDLMKFLEKILVTHKAGLLFENFGKNKDFTFIDIFKMNITATEKCLTLLKYVFNIDNEAECYSSLYVATDLNLFKNLYFTDNKDILDYLSNRPLSEKIVVSSRDKQVINHFTFQTNEDEYFFATTYNLISEYNKVTSRLYRLIIQEPIKSDSLFSDKDMSILNTCICELDREFVLNSYKNFLKTISSREFTNFVTIFEIEYLNGTEQIFKNFISHIKEDRIFRIFILFLRKTSIFVETSISFSSICNIAEEMKFNKVEIDYLIRFKLIYLQNTPIYKLVLSYFYKFILDNQCLRKDFISIIDFRSQKFINEEYYLAEIRGILSNIGFSGLNSYGLIFETNLEKPGGLTDLVRLRVVTEGERNYAEKVVENINEMDKGQLAVIIN